jgi:SAM-dependent methyltransferase
MTTTEVRVLDEQGDDRGYLKQRQNWWFDPAFPHSFELFDLDAFYEEPYYASDHVGPDTVRAYVDAVLHYGERLRGRPVRSVLECGCAGGWFTEEFLRRGIDVFAVEGSSAGVQRTRARGVPAKNVQQHDLRRPLQLERRFDIAVCTEVAEHIECPFSGQLVQNLVSHSDVVWFSFEPPDTNEAKYHHSNEQPAMFWINLFRFYGYQAI